MNVPMLCILDNQTVVLFRPYWLAYDYEVFLMLGDYGMYSPVVFENV